MKWSTRLVHATEQSEGVVDSPWGHRIGRIHETTQIAKINHRSIRGNVPFPNLVHQHDSRTFPKTSLVLMHDGLYEHLPRTTGKPI